MSAIPDKPSLTGDKLLAVDYGNSAVDEAPAVSPAASPTASSDAAAVPSDAIALSPARARFRSCRWRKPPEDGDAEYCVHRDVLPLAGSRGFDPEAWCLDCTFFKLRRTPRKNNH